MLETLCCVVQDGNLLSALLDVIADPYHYYKFANTSRTTLPEAFDRLLRSKLVQFFS